MGTALSRLRGRMVSSPPAPPRRAQIAEVSGPPALTFAATDRRHVRQRSGDAVSMTFDVLEDANEQVPSRQLLKRQRENFTVQQFVPAGCSPPTARLLAPVAKQNLAAHLEDCFQGDPPL